MTPISTLLFLNVYASRFVIIDVRSPRLFGAFVRVSLGVFCFRLGSLAIYPTVLSADLFGLFGWKAGSCPALLYFRPPRMSDSVRSLALREFGSRKLLFGNQGPVDDELTRTLLNCSRFFREMRREMSSNSCRSFFSFRTFFALT